MPDSQDTVHLGYMSARQSSLFSARILSKERNADSEYVDRRQRTRLYLLVDIEVSAVEIYYVASFQYVLTTYNLSYNELNLYSNFHRNPFSHYRVKRYVLSYRGINFRSPVSYTELRHWSYNGIDREVQTAVTHCFRFQAVYFYDAGLRKLMSRVFRYPGMKSRCSAIRNKTAGRIDDCHGDCTSCCLRYAYKILRNFRTPI
ncbi:hypothetical protein ANN_07874 [Periplaneta americana]|uniref:Uncharacterized protein n=1 Tax=Periplaneta americana TaxID=6978 RepID=A0ABQ8T138_PERAM|nr:hypothetical protein ANN_07874 [Periplaneta americana]